MDKMLLSKTLIYDKDAFGFNFQNIERTDDMSFILLNKTKNDFVMSSDSLSTKTDPNMPNIHSLRKIYSNMENTLAIGFAGNDATSYYDKNGKLEKTEYLGTGIIDKYISLYDESNFNNWLNQLIDEVYDFLPDDPNSCQFSQLLIVRKVNKEIESYYVYVTKEKNLPYAKHVDKLLDNVTTFSIGNDWLNYNKKHQFDEIPEDIDSIISNNRKEVKRFIDDRNIASIGGQVFTVYSE